ncbi:unnamed protein product [Mytilus coruscus]|uniref:BPTI/Kunitz inhibitor domain-containing protein n=1 Tax=Mytilus coruscus TaxID=42192 RepID=A0A6J7ZYE1_MYTCO|nr:unnamed protein product [Mytilus coruscus]
MLQYFVYFILQIVVLQIHDIEGRSEPIRDPCYLPKKTGPCRAAFRRYFYDANTGNCKSFIYGGCRGNGNNFKSVKECKRTCENTDIVDPIRPFDCGPVCKIFCPNGNVMDARGCPTCRCRSSPPVEGRCPRNSMSNIGCPIMKILNVIGTVTVREEEDAVLLVVVNGVSILIINHRSGFIKNIISNLFYYCKRIC